MEKREQEVYCGFIATADNEGYIKWNLSFIATTLKAALRKAHETKIKPNYAIKFTGVHPSMNDDNNYTYYGSRKDCMSVTPDDYTFYDGVGGLVIEKFPLIVDTEEDNKKSIRERLARYIVNCKDPRSTLCRMMDLKLDAKLFRENYLCIDDVADQLGLNRPVMPDNLDLLGDEIIKRCLLNYFRNTDLKCLTLFLIETIGDGSIPDVLFP